MLNLIIDGAEFYDEVTAKFIDREPIALSLEHSLFSMSKWESKVQKPFLAPGSKSTAEVVEYIRFMILTPDLPSDIWHRFTQDNITQINAYIESPQSATTFAQQQNEGPAREIITSELIYYWMVAYKIPFECQYWHLNRLFALIRICGIKNAPKGKQKMSTQEMLQRRHELNEQRKAQYNTTG